MKRLTVRGHVSTFTGYGQMLCEIVAGMEKRGIFCAIRPSDVSEPWGQSIPIEIKSKFVQCAQPEQWELVIRNPFESVTPGKKTAYFTMWESTLLPKEYVAILNRTNLVIVPSQWQKEGFAKSGVTVSIEIVPLGINEEVFSYVQPRPADGKLVIGIAGRVSHGARRKGIQRAINLFLQAFPERVNDVELRVKIHQDCEIEAIKDPRIIIERKHLGWADMRNWFGGLDMFLSLATVEGFGLLQLQAMACGRPVMAASYAGMHQFLTRPNSFCLPYKEVHNPDYGGGLWSEVSDQTVIKALLYAYMNRGEIREKGILAAETATEFTWEKTVENLHHLLLQRGVWA